MNDVSDMSGKTCLITGGAGSIGMASAKLLRSKGAQLALVDLNREALENTTIAAFGAVPDDVLLIEADVSLEDDAKRYVRETVDRFGAISTLFSNAGNFGTVAPIADYPTDIFDQVYKVHVRGAFLAANTRLRIWWRAAASSSRQASPGCAVIPAFMPISRQSTHKPV